MYTSTANAWGRYRDVKRGLGEACKVPIRYGPRGKSLSWDHAVSLRHGDCPLRPESHRELEVQLRVVVGFHELNLTLSVVCRFCTALWFHCL